MRKLTGLILMLLMAGGLIESFGQSPEETMQVNNIKSSGDYLYGEGYGDTPSEAAQMALQSLLANIGMTVDSKFH